MTSTTSPRGLLLCAVCFSLSASAGESRPADLGQRPQAGGTTILPEQFLRGYDPVTVYFPSDQVSSIATADDGAKRLKLAPDWPGAYVWVDRRTLQFRPAEPWPGLARFNFEAAGARRTLTTMMSAPSAMAPSPGAEGLKPFRVVTLTFPQALPVGSLKKMLSLELRELPGLADSPRKRLTEYVLAQLPRNSHRDPVTWTVTLPEDVPEGKQLVVSVALALGSEATTLWQGRASTRTAFGLVAVRCGNAEFPLVGGASTPKDMALGCGNRGDAPQLVFSAPLPSLTMTQLRQLVRFEPAVADLRFTLYGSRVQLGGKFLPDTLYKLTLGPAAIVDDASRPLRDVKPADVYFHLGWKASFLRWTQATAVLEAKGPRMLPLSGYGEPKADVRVYRVDALHNALWPFPQSPVVIDEQAAPPFPGEEPDVPEQPGTVGADVLRAHLKLLGSPLVSRVVDLPLADKAGTTNFGLDLKPLLDGVVGANRPGTYLVGLRRLTGRPERSYMRVQVTNLTVTSVEEPNQAHLYVRALDTGLPVKGATVTLEGTAKDTGKPVRVSGATDADGRFSVGLLRTWASITRVSIQSGEDVLVLDPNERLTRFANNHWSSSSQWLSWLKSEPVATPNDATLGFVFTERPIYKPGEPVFVKAYVRHKRSGALVIPPDLKPYGLLVRGPDGTDWPLKPAVTAQGALAAEFTEKDVPTGDYEVLLTDGRPDAVVARRSFKIEAYRVPTFEVQLSGPNRTRNDGPFKVKAIARYYAGGNLGNQPIKWLVTQRPFHWIPKGLDGYLFASSTQFAREASQSAGQTVRQEQELDDNGAGVITMNPQLDLDGSARVYRFEATVTGPDEQPVTNATEVKALPAFVLGLKVPRYLEKAAELKAELVAVGVDDKPQAGQEIRVRVFRRVWHSTLRETSFATGQAKYVTEQEDVKLFEQTVKSDGKPLPLSFATTEAGVYVVELFARDKLGRVQTLSADLYMGGQGPQAWAKSREGVFELKPDKKVYAPGETAHLLVQSPYTQAQALVVIEEPGANRYLWKDVQGGKVVVDVAIGERFTPNLPVHVVLMRGRIGEGKTDDARYKPATAAASIDLEIAPVKNTATVQVLFPEVAKPGTKHDFTILLTDEQKKPLGGEVTLWLVDEAVLSLAPEGSLDPLSEFIRRNQRSTTIHDSRNLVVGRLSELEEDPGGDGSEGDGDDGKKRVRKEFKTVPYYAATLVVPPTGNLVVPVQLSDDLTQFRVRAVAVSGPRFGVRQGTLKVRLPVLVQPQLPRFVRQGDTVWLGGVARLVEGAEGAGSVTVKIKGPVDGKPSTTQAIELKNNKASSVLTAVQVNLAAPTREPYLTVGVEVERKADKVGDAFEVKLPVLPDRPPERSSYFTQLAPGPTTLKPFPEAARPGSATQTLIVTNQPGVLELASGLDYLSAYPHGCLEQRMSQLAPDVALANLLKKLELDTRFTPQLSANVRRIVDELGQHQDDRGFLGYWPGSSGDLALTAAGLEFLTHAKKAGLPVDDKVRAKAVEALKRVLRSDFSGLWSEYRYNQQTSALRALAAAGELDENYLVELFHQRQGMDATSVADLTRAMAFRPNVFATNLTALKEDLWDRTVFKLVKGQQVFDRVKGDRSSWAGLYLGSPVATTAAVWEALLAIDPSNAKHTLIRDALLAQGSARGFGTTHGNRRAITALGSYLERAAFTAPSATVTVSGAKDVALTDGRIAGRRTVESDKPLDVKVVGAAALNARVQTRYVPAAPGSAAEPKKEGLIVSRTVTWLHPDGSPPTHHPDAPGAELKVALGDVVEVHTQLTTDEARTHVALIVPLPAGLEPMNPNLANASSDAQPSQSDSLSPTHVARLDDEVRYYFTELPKGTHTFHFRARASSEGRYTSPPPSAELMYREEVRGRGAGTKLVVTGAHEK